MGIVLETFGGVALFIILGLVVFFVLGSLITADNRGTNFKRLESLYGTRQIVRRDERVKILNQIRSMPKCNGRFTPEQEHLWRQYRELERIDSELTAQERHEIVEAQGYLPDDIADIVEGKR